ncbi:hypothetical protein, partial [Flavobacterium sp.]|uniref:hypothetical protein n=1 Tax=Flavobacterium sp. TaxID=239 RepID=UPI0037873548
MVDDNNNSESEVQKLIQELKRENEQLKLSEKELLIAKNKAELTSKKYTELFNHSASGHFTLSRTGTIINLNLVGSKIIGKENSQIINTLFDIYITEDSKSIFHDFFEKIFT